MAQRWEGIIPREAASLRVGRGLVLDREEDALRSRPVQARLAAARIDGFLDRLLLRAACETHAVDPAPVGLRGEGEGLVRLERSVAANHLVEIRLVGAGERVRRAGERRGETHREDHP